MQEKYGFLVTHLNIAKTKQKCGIIERENYNLPKSEDSRSPKTPKGKMRYAGMPLGMWALFAGSFREHLISTYGYDPETAKAVKRKTKPKYREIIGRLPEFKKADRNPYQKEKRIKA